MIPLPEPERFDEGDCWFDYYTAEQLRDYGVACAAEMRDRAAKECMNMQAGWASDDHMECAAAIRALGL